MKIAFCQAHNEEWEKKHLKAKLKGHNLVFHDAPVTEKNAPLFSDCDVLCVFVYSTLNKQVLSKLKKLKLISTMSTGFDHIDLKACKARKIAVCNVPSYGENTVAEHAMALLLAVSRHIVESVERTRRANFEIEGLRGFDLKDKTIGIIGTGNIGSHVCKYCRAFDMRILAHDKFPKKDFEKDYGVKYVPLDKLYRKSDVVTLHVPLLPSTEHMINFSAVKKMKKGVVIINTARGALVDTTAILMGLKKEIISWYATDVLEEEYHIKDERERLYETFKTKCDVQTLLEDHMLMHHDRVLITPHNAFNSLEALTRILDTTVDNIRAFVGGKPVNLVK